MIIRQWKGIVKGGMESNYINHLLTDTFPQLSQLKGFQKARITKRAIETGEEFLIVTEWDSIQSIESFTGKNIDVAIVPHEAAICMVNYDRVALHFEVLHEFGKG